MNRNRGRRLAMGGVGFVALLAVACDWAPPLANTQPSPMALGNAVLAALEHRDAAALRALALDEREFRDHVWHDLPAARPERNLPFSYVWGDLHQKSESSLAGTLADYGGHHFELVSVRFLDRTTQYATYLVHRKSALVVKDASGAELQLQLFGSMLEKDGQFKVFSFVVD